MTPWMNSAHLRTAVAAAMALTLGACGSSDSGSSTLADDQPGISGTPVPDSDDVSGGNDGAGAGDGTSMPVQEAEPGGNDTATAGPLTGITGQALNLGVVQIDQDPNDPDGGSVVGTFFRANLPVSASQISNAFIPQADTCSITRDDGEDIDTPAPDIGFDFDINLIDAGDALVLSSPAGTWLTLPRQQQFGFILYAPENDELPLPVPANLVLDVPGAEFPAFSNVSVPDVTPLTGVVTEGTSTFRWNAGSGDPSVFIMIELFSFSVGSESILVDCIARDDGEFTLPADIQATLGPDFAAFPMLERSGMTAVQLNDAVLLVSNSSAANAQ